MEKRCQQIGCQWRRLKEAAKLDIKVFFGKLNRPQAGSECDRFWIKIDPSMVLGCVLGQLSESQLPKIYLWMLANFWSVMPQERDLLIFPTWKVLT
jgi:hypothetical protein